MLEFFMENTLILPHHSGFKTVDSSINLLLSITHEIYILFYDGYEVKGIFLDISNLKYGIQIFSINQKKKKKWYKKQSLKYLHGRSEREGWGRRALALHDVVGLTFCQ